MSVKKRKDGRWYYDIVIHLNGKRVRVRKAAHAQDRAEALRKEREERLKLERGTFAIGKIPLFQEFSEEFLINWAKPYNKRSEVRTKSMILRLHLNPFFGAMRLDEPQVVDFDKYVAAKLADGYSKKYVKNHLILLQCLYTKAVEWGRIAKAPKFPKIKAPKPPFDFLSFKEADELLDAAQAWRPRILVAVRAGLRQGEMLALQWDHLNFETEMMQVSQGFSCGAIETTKGDKVRNVPMGQQVLDELRPLKKEHHGTWVFPAEMTFPGAGPRMLTAWECHRALHRVCDRAKIRRIGWHTLRHTFASHLVMRGVPLPVVKELLGHASIEMTMRYAHLSPGMTRDAVRMLDQAAPERPNSR